MKGATGPIQVQNENAHLKTTSCSLAHSVLRKRHKAEMTQGAHQTLDAIVPRVEMQRSIRRRQSGNNTHTLRCFLWLSFGKQLS